MNPEDDPLDDAPWCVCGEPDRVAEAMLRYLTPEPGKTIVVVGDDLESLLLAYMADGAGWTEHGGTVRAAWLTEKGKAARAALGKRR